MDYFVSTSAWAVSPTPCQTGRKLGIEVWDYLGRLKVAGHVVVQPFDRYVRGRFRPA